MFAYFRIITLEHRSKAAQVAAAANCTLNVLPRCTSATWPRLTGGAIPKRDIIDGAIKGPSQLWCRWQS